ncbi:MAG: S9 family peptidase, partial [Flavobacteriales bacterium]|nr:S9 family peptidase [Flavobacteriales bacterium]
MKIKNLVCLGIAVALFSCKNDVETKENKSMAFKYPNTKEVDTVDTYFGVDVKDPFRWLEDDRSEETKKWVTEQNKVTFDYLSKLPMRDAIKDRLKELWNYPKYSSPFKRGDYYYFYKNDGLQNQYVLYRQKSLNDSAMVFLDPNKLNEKGTSALGSTSFSKDARYFAYAINEAGSDWATIYVRDTETGKDLEDKLEWVKFSGMAWAGNGFYYSRYEEPKGSELSAQNEYHKVYFHKIGEPQSKDQIAFEQKDYPKRYFFATTSEDEKHLIVNGTEGTHGSQLFYKNLATNSEFLQLNDNFDWDHQFVEASSSNLYFLTNKNAPNYKLVSVGLRHPVDGNWKDLIEQHEKNVLEGVSFIGEKMFCTYLSDAYHRLYQFELDGKGKKEITLPSIGSVSGLAGRKEDNVFYFSFTSFTNPSTIYKFDIPSGQLEVYRETEAKINPDDFITEQIFYKSKDGTKVPMFLVYKKGLDRSTPHPTYLYSYGGFNISLNPRFRITMLPFLENGGVFAMPNIRG